MRSAAARRPEDQHPKWRPPSPRRPIATTHPSDLGWTDKGSKPIHPVIVWRDHVVGPDGPALPTTRSVLLTLSVHMDERGYAFPSIALLALESRLSENAVKRHLKLAVSEGWINRTEGMGYKQGWRCYEYEAAIPVFEGGVTVLPRSAWREVRETNRRNRRSAKVGTL